MIVHLKEDTYFNMEYVMTLDLKVNNNTANIIALLINGQTATLFTTDTEANARKKLKQLVHDANRDKSDKHDVDAAQEEIDEALRAQALAKSEADLEQLVKDLKDLESKKYK